MGRVHAFANDWLDKGVAEGDLMRLMGWSSRSMFDRYGEQADAARSALFARLEREVDPDGRLSPDQRRSWCGQRD